jgi:hypothetical protein
MCYRGCLISIFLAMFALKAYAFSEQPIPVEDEWKPLEVTGDAIPWSLFATTKEITDCIDDDGIEICTISPEYSSEVNTLNDKEVALMGYMFPLEQSNKQQNFLIGPYPLSCPFHYHIGPSQFVEVLSEEAIEFSYEPIRVKGLFSVQFNEETGVFFYLKKARLSD